jgi:hypothetical protein
MWITRGLAWPTSKNSRQCMKNHKRMMIGMGTPTNQRIKLRPIILLHCFSAREVRHDWRRQVAPNRRPAATARPEDVNGNARRGKTFPLAHGAAEIVCNACNLDQLFCSGPLAYFKVTGPRSEGACDGDTPRKQEQSTLRWIVGGYCSTTQTTRLALNLLSRRLR